ncbi:MAG: hypothetical protein U5R31_16740 [Acidimicrobiia bacterium]|nr:hypothetical protein [Acidimicrobiia bacterium]
MAPKTKTAAGCATGALALLVGMLAMPFLAVAASGPRAGACATAEVADDGTPSILGPPTLTAAGLQRLVGRHRPRAARPAQPTDRGRDRALPQRKRRRRRAR